MIIHQQKVNVVSIFVNILRVRLKNPNKFRFKLSNKQMRNWNGLLHKIKWKL